MESNRLTIPVRSEHKTQAIEDARAHQNAVWEECEKTGKEPPPYILEELIGKGAFGRVYKGYDHVHVYLLTKLTFGQKGHDYSEDCGSQDHRY